MTVLKGEATGTVTNIALHSGTPQTWTASVIVDGTDWSSRMSGFDIEITPQTRPDGTTVQLAVATTTINGQTVTLQGPISFKVTAS